MLLDGLLIPLTTPFYPDGRLYVRKLEANVARYSLTLASGLMALSHAGESALLSDEERRQVLVAVSEVASKDKVLLASVGQPGVRATLDLAEFAAKQNHDAVLVGLPDAYAEQIWAGGEPTSIALTYLRTIADRSPLPVILVSRASSGRLPVHTIAELADHPNVLGLLEQSGHLSRVADVLTATRSYRRTVTVTPTFAAVTGRMLRTEVEPNADRSFVSAETLAGGSAVATAIPAPAMKTREKAVGFQIIWSRSDGAVSAFRAGAVAFSPDMAAAVPQACFELWASWKDGDTSLMEEKGSRLVRGEEALSSLGVAGLKFASEGSGYFGGRPRLPLLPLTASDTEKVQTAFAGMRS